MSPGTSINNPSTSENGALTAWRNADLPWASCAWSALQHLAGSPVPFTADHVRALVLEPDHPNRFGGLFQAAMKAGLIRCVGYRTSVCASRHGGVQREWMGTQHAHN